ncbi:cytochrome P450 monooxygenase-like protein [Ilyonectria destructans]|nr:cytochrome P450 monooxygenase-like protein [Ilyonectria destructans]
MESMAEVNVGSVRALLSPANILYLVGLWVAHSILTALYNASPFHPLSRFPGPKLAAATYLYEAYFEWWLVGRYGHEIRRMHERYGPIVRINPHELHCSDPYFTDEIYAGGGRVRDKWQHQLNTGGAGPVSVSAFSTVPHEVHRIRRSALSRFFSRQQMLKLEDEVHEFAQLLVNKMLRSAGKKPFDIKEAFNCFTADIISQYCFGEPMGFLSQDGWEPNFATMVKPFLRNAYIMRYNALARKLADVLPWLTDYMGEDIKAVTRHMNVIIPRYIKDALDNPENGRVFADLVQSKTLPESDKSMYRLSGEGSVFLLAGTETTATTLTVIMYHLLDQPAIYARLMEDLQDIDPSNLKWIDLEGRPYLWAVIHEALRMTPGISSRSARIARTEDLVYKSQDGEVEWVIPRGTPIGMTSMINHWNKELFPRPDDFLPERWLIDSQPNHRLEKMLISFGKGNRSCLGDNLAYCEIYIMVALMAFRVLPRARLYETTIEDIKYDHDLIVPHTKNGAVSVRIVLV